MKKIYLYCIISLLYFTSCQQKKQSKETLHDYFKKEFNTKIPDQVHTLIVLDDIGCKGCNENLHYWIQKKALNHEKIWILVIASGSFLDISPYLNPYLKNVFVEQSIEGFKKLNIFTSSGFIFLKQGKIEKTVSLSAPELQKQFELLDNRLNMP